jgi:cell division protein YceG involved in septum cleavage
MFARRLLGRKRSILHSIIYKVRLEEIFMKLLFKKQTALSIFCMTIVLVSIIAGTTMVIKAEEPAASQKLYKYYTTVQIEEGDTLWSIAEQYTEGTDCSIQEYIAELKQMNGLKDDTITAGCNLIVSYYSDVYMK